jgi:hypothetical protein
MSDYDDEDRGPPNFGVWLLASLLTWGFIALAVAVVIRSI